MSRYSLTGRGWVLAFVVAALLLIGTYALVSAAFGSEPDSDIITSPDASIPEEPTPNEPSDSPDDPTPLLSPTPSPSPTPEEPTPSTPSPSPPDTSPDTPTPPQTTASPKPSPAPSPSPPPEVVSPVQVSPPPSQPSVPPTAVSPEPTPTWADGKAAIMFDFDSGTPSDVTLAISDLDALLPSLNELTGYVVVISAYTASDETTEGLAQRRADAIQDILTDEMDIPAAMIRTQAASEAGGTERYRQRADVYFLYVGNK